MIVKARLAGIFNGTPITAEGQVELDSGSDVKKLFIQADDALGFGRRRYFRSILKMSPPPTLLLNGDRLDLPEGLNKTLEPGDEITVVTALAGG